MNLSRRLSAGLVAMLAFAALGAAPAVAAPTVTSRVATNTVPGTGGHACAVDRGGKRGHLICGTVYTDVTFSDGRRHTFGIGMSHAVANIVEYAPAGPAGGSSNWVSLVGWLQRGVRIRYARSKSDLGIWAYGAGATGGRPWCKNLWTTWRPWYACRIG